MQYKIGQVLTAQEDIDVQMALSGAHKTIRKGSKAIIGADRCAHHFDGIIRPLSKDLVVSGYDAYGIADYIYKYLCNNCGIDEVIEECDVSSIELKENIRDALEELGFM